MKVLTWNVWFADHHLERRCETLLRELREADADLIALQEVTPYFLDRLLAEPWVRGKYQAPDGARRWVTPYGVMILTRIEKPRFELVPLECYSGRPMLVCEVGREGGSFALASVHLASGRHNAFARGEQLEEIFRRLEPYPDGVLAGDFNFCSSWTDENDRLDPRWIDLWPSLRPGEPGFTEDTAINRMRLEHSGKEKQVRFDRLLLRSEGGDLTGRTIDLVGTRPVSPTEPAIFPSDHFGLVAELAWKGARA